MGGTWTSSRICTHARSLPSASLLNNTHVCSNTLPERRSLTAAASCCSSLLSNEVFAQISVLIFQPPILILEVTVIEASDLEAKDADGKELLVKT